MDYRPKFLFSPSFFIGVLLVLKLTNLSFGLRRSPPIRPFTFSLPPPKLTLGGYLLSDQYKWVNAPNVDLEDNDFISKNGSDYTASEDVIGILFTCEAHYPIEGKFPYPEVKSKIIKISLINTIRTWWLGAINPILKYQQLRYSSIHGGTASKRISQFDQDLDEPLTLSYLHYMQINFIEDKFVSATMACQAVGNPMINSTVHVYTSCEFLWALIVKTFGFEKSSIST